MLFGARTIHFQLRVIMTVVDDQCATVCCRDAEDRLPCEFDAGLEIAAGDLGVQMCR